MTNRITEEGEEYSPCTRCGDSNCTYSCTYYTKYLNADSAAEAKELFIQAVHDFQNLNVVQLMQKKRKVSLHIGENKTITKNTNKGQECHNRKIML